MMPTNAPWTLASNRTDLDDVLLSNCIFYSDGWSSAYRGENSSVCTSDNAHTHPSDIVASSHVTATATS